MARFYVDGREVEYPAGTILLEVLRDCGADLPTLCHWDGLPPYGACRLCLVEVAGGNSAPPDQARHAQIVASCTYPVEDGISVRTYSREALAVRRMMLEFMLARCPDSEVIQELAAKAGITESRFSGNGHPNELCMLCGLCVRICRDLIGAAAIGFSGRGSDRKVSTPYHLNSKACIGCGACAAVCPTGAIHIEDVDGLRVLHTWNTSVPLHTCPECGEPFTPEPMAFLKGLVPVSADSWGLCPKCRRQAALGQLEFIRERA